jgi:hypothetical protein
MSRSAHMTFQPHDLAKDSTPVVDTGGVVLFVFE